MISSTDLDSRKECLNRPIYEFVMGKKEKHPDLRSGRLKMGLIVAAPGESVYLQVLNFALYVSAFPKVEKIALASGKLSLGSERLLAELISAKGTVAVDAKRFLKESGEFRPFWPGHDSFPRNGEQIRWLSKQVRQKVRAPDAKYARHLVLLHTLPPLPDGFALNLLHLNEVLFSIGRVVEQHCDFIAIYRNGKLDFLKNRIGNVFPDVSWKI